MEIVQFNNSDKEYIANISRDDNRFAFEFDSEIPSDVDASIFRLLTESGNIYGEFIGYQYIYKKLENGFILSNIDEVYCEPLIVDNNIVFDTPIINTVSASTAKPQILEDSKLLIYAKGFKQNDNKLALENFLELNPIKWTDGLVYGITQEDQNEMVTDKAAYDLKQSLGDTTWKLEWHSLHGACKEFTVEEFTSLLNEIVNFVYPYRRLQEDYKTQIYGCTTIEELDAIALTYEVK